MAIETTSSEAELDSFYKGLEKANLAPLWPIAEQLMPLTPRPKAVPWMWRWKEMFTLAERAGELITIARGGDRRVLSLANPGLDGLPYASPTLWGAVQYLNPGESAPAHRHSPGAIRFVLQGDGVYTTVNGDACDMSPGDLILTPSQNWHDHNSRSDEPMVWFDGLDMPLVLALDAIFFENYPDEELQPVTGRNASEQAFAGKGLVPADRVGAKTSHSPLLAYRRDDIDRALSALMESDPNPMVSVEFCDPVTGRPALPTMGCRMHRLGEGDRTPTVRRTGSSVFVVYQGSGVSVIDGKRFEWESGDMFVIPSWAAADHEAFEVADLFSISDEPVLRALSLYREEALAEHQEIVGEFTGEWASE